MDNPESRQSDDPPIGWLVGKPGETPMSAHGNLDEAMRYIEGMEVPDIQGFAIHGLKVWSMTLNAWITPSWRKEKETES